MTEVKGIVVVALFVLVAIVYARAHKYLKY